MRRALITERGDSRATLAGVRALAAAGWEVAVGSPIPDGLPGASRHVARVHHVPQPERDLDGFLDAVADAVERHGYDLVFPSEDPQVLALSAHRERFPGRVPYPAHDVVLGSLDKLDLARAAERAGVGTPRTVEGTPDRTAAWSGDGVVKPRLHNELSSGDAPAHFDTAYVRTAGEAEAAAEALRRWGVAPVLQEAVHGEQVSLAAVALPGGRVVSAIQQRVVRMYPLPAGISARAETLPVDEAIVAAAERLFAELGWWGLVQLQFRVRAAGDATPLLIDFNPRFYGSLALAAHAGVNLPAAWAAVALGEDPPAGPARARPGRRYQWLEGDLRTGLSLASARRPWPLLGAAAYAVGAGHSVWSPGDPRPALRLAGTAAARGARKLRRRGS